MIIWTPAVLSVLYACFVLCICTCSAQLSMFYMERCSTNMLIIIIIIIIKHTSMLQTGTMPGLWHMPDNLQPSN